MQTPSRRHRYELLHHGRKAAAIRPCLQGKWHRGIPAAASPSATVYQQQMIAASEEMSPVACLRHPLKFQSCDKRLKAAKTDIEEKHQDAAPGPCWLEPHSLEASQIQRFA